MTEQTRIVIDPQICHGAPCVRGLRYPVTMILELLASGMSHAEILANWQKRCRFCTTLNEQLHDDFTVILSFSWLNVKDRHFLRLVPATTIPTSRLEIDVLLSRLETRLKPRACSEAKTTTIANDSSAA